MSSSEDESKGSRPIKKTKPMMGGVIHTYQKYDPGRIPSPNQPENGAELASFGMEWMLQHGGHRELTEEELARAVRIDPSQIENLGPSLDALAAILQSRKEKILATYETRTVTKRADKAYWDQAGTLSGLSLPKSTGLALFERDERQFNKSLNQAIQSKQIYDLERLWYQVGDDQSDLAKGILKLTHRLSDEYEIYELKSQYTFTGQQPMTVAEALQIKAELEEIDRLLEQLKEAQETAQIGIIDMDALSQFTEPDELQPLSEMRQQIGDMLRQMAEAQGLEFDQSGARQQFQLTPKAMRLFQGKLLERIFSEMDPGRTGKHEAEKSGEGVVEKQRTRPYEFGDAMSNVDLTGSIINSVVSSHHRQSSGQSSGWRMEDMLVHETRNHPKAATMVVMDMSGSMLSGGQYVPVKRMALALDGLIRQQYPGDFLRFMEMYSFAKPCLASDVVKLMPKMHTTRQPVVRLKVDMSDPDITEHQVHPHFTNIQHALQSSRLMLANQDTPNKQIIIITDGLPTAHFEGDTLFLLYPPDPRTENATLREAALCAREGITINMFLIPSWSQSEEDIRFAYKVAESTKGRVIFTGGDDLDRFVVWDYLSQQRHMIQ